MIIFLYFAIGMFVGGIGLATAQVRLTLPEQLAFLVVATFLWPIVAIKGAVATLEDSEM